MRQRRFAGARRTVEDDRAQPIGRQQPPQQLAFAQKMLLADELVQRCRAASAPPAAALVDDSRLQRRQITTWQRNCTLNAPAHKATTAGRTPRLKQRLLTIRRTWWAKPGGIQRRQLAIQPVFVSKHLKRLRNPLGVLPFPRHPPPELIIVHLAAANRLNAPNHSFAQTRADCAPANSQKSAAPPTATATFATQHRRRQPPQRLAIWPALRDP